MNTQTNHNTTQGNKKKHTGEKFHIKSDLVKDFFKDVIICIYQKILSSIAFLGKSCRNPAFGCMQDRECDIEREEAAIAASAAKLKMPAMASKNRRPEKRARCYGRTNVR